MAKLLSKKQENSFFDRKSQSKNNRCIISAKLSEGELLSGCETTEPLKLL